MSNGLLKLKTKPCMGCRDTSPHDSHLTMGSRIRLRAHRLIRKFK